MNDINRPNSKEQKKEKLDKELLTKIMAMASDSVNEEKVFKTGDFRITIKLSDDKFIVRIGKVVEVGFTRDAFMLGRYTISGDGTVESIHSRQGNMKVISEKGYSGAIQVLKNVLNSVEIENL